MNEKTLFQVRLDLQQQGFTPFEGKLEALLDSFQGVFEIGLGEFIRFSAGYRRQISEVPFPDEASSSVAEREPEIQSTAFVLHAEGKASGESVDPPGFRMADWVRARKGHEGKFRAVEEINFIHMETSKLLLEEFIVTAARDQSLQPPDGPVEQPWFMEGPGGMLGERPAERRAQEELQFLLVRGMPARGRLSQRQERSQRFRKVVVGEIRAIVGLGRRRSCGGVQR